MKEKVKRVLIVLALLFTGILLIGLMLHKPLPQGVAGPEAEALADSMLVALNEEAYQQIDWLRWSYPKGHHYEWDKQKNLVNVKWADYEVTFSPDQMRGSCRKGGNLLSGRDKDEVLQKAWSFFANDSFWLIAPFKIRDSGTERYLVETERGRALLVTYTSGGVTPGDSYLWILDDSFRPVAWQLWVSILPVGGLEFSWEGWTQKQGAWFALTHSGPKDIHLTDLQVK